MHNLKNFVSVQIVVVVPMNNMVSIRFVVLIECLALTSLQEMISFSRGERIGVIFFDQFQDEEYIPIGQTYNNELNVSENLIIWPGKFNIRY